MIRVVVPAPRVKKLQKTKGGYKKLPNGKRAPAVERPAWLNANQRFNHHKKASYVSKWRESARLAAEAAGTPRDMRSRYFVIARIHLPRQVTYDASNYYPAVKACIDGIITDHGFLPDDSNAHLVGPLHLEGVKAEDGFGGITLEFYGNTAFDEERLLINLWGIAPRA